MKSVASLSLEQAPPLWLLLRFFLTAPLFGMAAGVLLLVMGPEALASRWIPGVMALTHLFTLGFITMVMCGAALQVLPVLGGIEVPGVLLVGPAVHLLMTIGTLALNGGFITGHALAFDTAVVSLAGALLLFLGAAGLGLWRVKTLNPTVHALRGALLALLLTLLLGVYLVKLLSGYGASAHMLQVIDLHLGWALLGWVGLMVLGVGFQVVPLFQMTKEYPKWLSRWAPWGLPVLLIAWTWAVATGAGLWRLLAEVCLAAVYMAFAVQTLWLQRQRKRRVADSGIAFWRTSAVATVLAAILWAVGLSNDTTGWEWYPMLLGTSIIGGVVLTVIIGMLYKIVPFLAWFHLQQSQMVLLNSGPVKIPHMQQLLPAAPVRWQFRLHLAVLCCAAAAVVFPGYLARPLGLLLLMSFALLGYNLLGVARLYRRENSRLAQIQTASDNEVLSLRV